MTRPNLLIAVLLSILIAVGCSVPSTEAPAAKPNIIFILIDDLGWADTGPYGNQHYDTPNLDRLAAEGMRFTNGYAACAVCSPTRAAVMTGRYPARLGVTDWIRARFQGGDMPADGKNPSGWDRPEGRQLETPQNALWMESSEITIAEQLKQAGYTSAYIGKWHLGMDDWYPRKQGFDLNFGGCDFGQPPSYFDPYTNERHNIPGIPFLPARQPGEYLTDREADEAANFIREHRDKPFYLNLANYAVHTPIQAKEDLIEKYKAKGFSDSEQRIAYAAMVESMDDSVGRVMDTLDELALAENTLIIFTSDNGGLLGPTTNTPLRSGKGYPYEGGVRVPVIARWPGVIQAGSTSDFPVTSVDYLPTISEVVGVDLPADRAIDGLSLVPLLKQSATTLDRDAIFWHFPHYRGKDVVPYSIVRAGDWKFIKRYDGKPYELFDLKSDPAETSDISAEQPEKVAELDQMLAQWLEDTKAKMPRPRTD
jgi:arylsulfatase A-like enzyme